MRRARNRASHANPRSPRSLFRFFRKQINYSSRRNRRVTFVASTTSTRFLVTTTNSSSCQYSYSREYTRCDAWTVASCGARSESKTVAKCGQLPARAIRASGDAPCRARQIHRDARGEKQNVLFIQRIERVTGQMSGVCERCSSCISRRCYVSKLNGKNNTSAVSLAGLISIYICYFLLLLLNSTSEKRFHFFLLFFCSPTSTHQRT